MLDIRSCRFDLETYCALGYTEFSSIRNYFRVFDTLSYLLEKE